MIDAAKGFRGYARGIRARRTEATTQRPLRVRGIRMVPFEPILKTAALQSLFVALNVGPHARRVIVWLVGAVAAFAAGLLLKK